MQKQISPAAMAIAIIVVVIVVVLVGWKLFLAKPSGGHVNPEVLNPEQHAQQMMQHEQQAAPTTNGGTAPR